MQDKSHLLLFYLDGVKAGYYCAYTKFLPTDEEILETFKNQESEEAAAYLDGFRDGMKRKARENEK